MAFFTEYALFFFKTVTLLVAILALFAGILTIAGKNKLSNRKIRIEKLNTRYQKLAETLNQELLPKKLFKNFLKTQKKKQKESDQNASARKLFVLRFSGDLRASAVENLSEEITALLTVAQKDDEVVVCIESPGGIVHGYGLAASQLERIKRADIRLTACVDKIAASGGYLMACVADKILSAPFAIIGSIGAVMQLPNFHRLLKLNHIDYELLTAGKFKRTLSLFGENTEEGRQKCQEQLEDIHVLFKDFIQHFRPQLPMETVATGEFWFGQRALELKLIDNIQSSDDYLMQASKTYDVYEISTPRKKNLSDKLGISAFFKLFENTAYIG